MPERWVEFLQLVHKEFPDFEFVALGGIWDIDTIQEIKGLLPETFPLIDLVGKTNISDCIRILDTLDYYIGFSSGLNCIRNVLNKPCAVMWPKHQKALMYSHPDPETIERRDYIAFIYDEPERVFNRIKSKLREVLYLKIPNGVMV